MAKEQLKLTGIQRNRRNRDFSPGSCNEIINMRFRDGAWEAVGNKKIYDTITGYTPEKMLAFHDMIDAQNLIFLTSSGQVVSKTHGGAYQVLLTGITDIRANTLNNVLVLSTDTRLHYFTYNEGAYVASTFNFDDFHLKRGIGNPWWWYNMEYNFDFYSRNDSGPISEVVSKKFDYVDVTNHDNRETILSYIAEFRQLCLDRRIPVGPVLMTATVVLFDDTEVAHTPIVQTNFGYITYFPDVVAPQETKFSCSAKDYVDGKGFKFTAYGMNATAVPRGLIKGIRIYISRMPALYEVEDYTDYSIRSYGITRGDDLAGYHFRTTYSESNCKIYMPKYKTSSNKTLSEIISGTNYLFFQKAKEDDLDTTLHDVGFVSIEDIEADGSFYIDFRALGDDLIATYKALPVDNFTGHKMAAKSIDLYNGRVFLSNTKLEFPSPRPIDHYNIQGDYINNTLYVWYKSGETITAVPFIGQRMVSIEYTWGGTVSNQYRVVSSFTDHGYWNGTAFQSSVVDWSTITSVYKVMFEVMLSTDEGEKIVRGDYNNLGVLPYYFGMFSYPDSRAHTLNIYVGDGGADATKYTIKLKPSELHNYSYGVMKIMYEEWGTILSDQGVTISGSGSLTSQTQFLTEPNRVQASESNNPFVFPAVNSYRVGNSEIIGLQTVNNEMSQGQFGDFPMIAFTKSGIWAMQIGNGDLLISSIVPLANEVCNNPDSITAIRKGILFSSNEGLKILQGSKVVEISDILEGDPANAIKSGAVYSEVINKEGFTSAISDIDFLEYIKGAKIGYDDYNEELIISNPEKHYSYIFSLTNKYWAKINTAYDGFFCKYPYLLAFSSNIVYHTNDETYGSTKKVLFISNVLNFANAFTKIDQAMLRGKLGRGRVIIFGSTDNIRWQMISIGTSPSGGYDLKIPRSFYSCVSFIIAFDGNFKTDSYFQHIELDLKQRYQFKFR